MLGGGGGRAKWFTSIPRSALVVNISFWPREGNGISELWCVRDTCGAWFLRVLLSPSCGKVNIESSNDKFWRDMIGNFTLLIAKYNTLLSLEK